MAQKQIFVYDINLALVGIVEDYEEATYTRKFYECSTFSIKINRNVPNAALLTKNAVLIFGDDVRDSGIITTLADEIGERGKGSQYLTATGYDLRYMFTWRNVRDLNSVDSYYQSAPGETVIKTLVDSQCGPGATNAKRKFPGFTIASDGARGLDYTISTKYTTVYDECAAIALKSAIGWFVTPDVTTKTFTLDCEEGVNRTAGQSVNPWCIFDPDLESVRSCQKTDSIEYYRNFVYVGGDGQGAARTIVDGFGTTEPEGFDRFEMFDDASTLTTTTDMNVEAQAVLEKFNKSVSIEGEGLIKSPFVYKEQYYVGDLVTVRFSGTSSDVRITEITEHWQYGQYDISQTLGRPIETASDQIGSLSSNATNTASTSESGTNTSGMKNGVLGYDITSADITMNAAECIYNVIEITGAPAVDRTLALYLDTIRLYGRKVYSMILLYTGGKSITFTTGIGGTDTVTIPGSAAPCELRVYVDAAGNVTASHADALTSVAVSDGISGDGTSGNPLALTDTGVNAGTYKSVTVDANGRVTGGTNPDTLALGETSSTAYRGDRGKTAYDHSQSTGNPHGTVIADISTLTGKITPPSDLNLVLSLNGDGVPMIPDNAAGIEYAPNFSTTDSWAGNNSSLSVVSNVLKITATTSALYGTSRSFSVLNERIIRLRIRTSRATTVYLKLFNGSGYPIFGSKQTSAGIWTFIDGYATGSTNNALYIDTASGATAGDTIEISQEATYVGSGLFDTPLYDKSCCNVFVNHGVLVVKGKRGLALSFNGAAWLEANNPVTGITGTLSFILTTGDDITTRQRVLSNRTYSPNAGISVSIYNGELLVEGSEDEHSAYAVSANTDYTLSFDFTPTTYAVSINGVQVTNGSAVFSLATSVLYIGRAAHYAGEYLEATLHGFRYTSSVMTADEKIRYHNGDDAVDSQQKAITNVPNAIKICDSKGNIRQPGLPVYADNAAALAGGLVEGEPYRTSTGVLMIVY